VSGTKAKNSLKFGEVSDFRDEIALTQPIFICLIVLVVKPPFALLTVDSIGPPPRVNVEVIEGR
jgi:hypothetical protein